MGRSQTFQPSFSALGSAASSAVPTFLFSHPFLFIHCIWTLYSKSWRISDHYWMAGAACGGPESGWLMSSALFSFCLHKLGACFCMKPFRFTTELSTKQNVNACLIMWPWQLQLVTFYFYRIRKDSPPDVQRLKYSASLTQSCFQGRKPIQSLMIF